VSQRFEIDDVHTNLQIVGPEADLGEYELGPGCHALTIGDLGASATAITGSLDELQTFAHRVADLVGRSFPTTPGTQHGGVRPREP
jgi:hypothetical protein